MRIKFISRTYTSSCGGFTYRSMPGHPEHQVCMDTDCDDYDWLVVYDDVPNGSTGTIVAGAEKLACPREQTMLLTSEPTSVKHYGRAYVHQFGHYLTNRPASAERHPNYHLGQGYYACCTGKTWDETVNQVLPPKTELISAVCSAKKMRHTRHADRYRLVCHLSKTIPELVWYGWGVRHIDRKCDALDAFKYHLALENHIAEGHWSEKVADALLSECLPFYAGDPMLGEILPPESFIPIPIDDPVAAERVVKKAIADGEYEKRLPAIRAARKLILEKYNMWSQISFVIEAAAGQPITPVDLAHPQFIKSRHRLRRSPMIALTDGFSHLVKFFMDVGL